MNPSLSVRPCKRLSSPDYFFSCVRAETDIRAGRGLVNFRNELRFLEKQSSFFQGSARPKAKKIGGKGAEQHDRTPSRPGGGPPGADGDRAGDGRRAAARHP